MTMPCIVLGQLILLGLAHAHTFIGLSLLASIGAIKSNLFLLGACSCFCSLDLALISCQSVWVNRVYTHCGGVAVANQVLLIFKFPALHTLRQQYAPLLSTNTDTVWFFFAQQDHRVSGFVVSCCDVLQI